MPVGYAVIRLPFDSPGGLPTGATEQLLEHDGATAEWPTGVRPVDVAFSRKGTLFVTSDKTNEIFQISFDPTIAAHAPASSAAATASPSASSASLPVVCASPTDWTWLWVLVGVVGGLVLAAAAYVVWTRKRRPRTAKCGPVRSLPTDTKVGR